MIDIWNSKAKNKNIFSEVFFLSLNLHFVKYEKTLDVKIHVKYHSTIISVNNSVLDRQEAHTMTLKDKPKPYYGYIAWWISPTFSFAKVRLEGLNHSVCVTYFFLVVDEFC